MFDFKAFLALCLSYQTAHQRYYTVNKLDEVLVSAVRVTTKHRFHLAAVSKSNRPRNLGQDIPILMNYLSVVTTSDAGVVGYRIRVRGSDAT
jgi:iron complex outermembrane receptor protein